MNAGLGLSGLQALLEAGRLLTSSVSLEGLLRDLLRTVMGRLLVTRGLIAIEENGTMRVALARGVQGLATGNEFDEPAAASAKLELLYKIQEAGKVVGILA